MSDFLASFAFGIANARKHTYTGTSLKALLQLNDK